jgi:hypothetical protein
METKTTGNQKPAETKPQTKPADKPEPKAEAKPTTKSVAAPKVDIPKPQTMANITKEIDTLWQAVSQQNKLITELQEAVARKRRPPASNGKVQIRDKKTGRIFPSKNNAYQTLLREGALKSLVDKGVFGADPQRNSYGWYQLVREWPDRFEELTDKANDKPGGKDTINNEKAKATSTAVPQAK